MSNLATTICVPLSTIPQEILLRSLDAKVHVTPSAYLCALTDLRGFYEPLCLALEFLQPVKRRRGKSSEDDPAGGKKRRRCRVSDEEYERLRLAKMVHHRPYHQPAFPLLPAKDEAARPTRGVVIASAVQPSAAQAC